MNTHDAILNIRASGETAVGRTVLQKLMYLQGEIGVEIEARYVLHYTEMTKFVMPLLPGA